MATRFRFEHSFDNGAAEQAAREAARIAIELEEAESRGYARGHSEGSAEAHASLEASTEAALGRIMADMTVLYDHLDRVRRQLIADAALVAAAGGAALAGTIARQIEDHRLSEAFSAALADHLDSPRIVVRVSDSLLDAARSRMESAASAQGFSGKLIFLSDPALACGDATIEWAHGGLCLDLAQAQEQLKEAAGRFAQHVVDGCELNEVEGAAQ